MFVGRLDRLDGDRRGGFAQRGKNPARVEPAHTQFAENLLPIEITGLELARCRMAAIRHADRATNAKPTLRKV